MKEQHTRLWGKANWITAVVMLLAYLTVNLLAPDMNPRWKLLIALGAACAAGLVIYLVKKRQKEKEDEKRLPPI